MNLLSSRHPPSNHQGFRIRILHCFDSLSISFLFKPPVESTVSVFYKVILWISNHVESEPLQSKCSSWWTTAFYSPIRPPKPSTSVPTICPIHTPLPTGTHPDVLQSPRRSSTTPHKTLHVPQATFSPTSSGAIPRISYPSISKSSRLKQLLPCRLSQ